jgi:hypothetical protein
MNIQDEIRKTLQDVAEQRTTEAEAQIKINELYRGYYSQQKREPDLLKDIRC